MKRDAEQVLTRKMRRILLISLIFTGFCAILDRFFREGARRP